MRLKLTTFTLIVLSVIGCNTDSTDINQDSADEQVFVALESSLTGIDFNNEIIENKEINYYTYVYLYNGGGVGIADINNDNLPDVYLTSTMGKDKLYLNKGNLKFEDISTSAGIENFTGHKTGVTFTDINNDGWIDIYVCRSSWTTSPEDLKNLLFVNNQDNTFTEQASKYGIDDTNHSVQAVFFDYDRDGDNDLFISNQPGEFKQLLVDMIDKIENSKPEYSDKLYRNDGDTFTDVTIEAGLLNYGYGLGVTATDFNNDGFVDLYVANDFAPHDYYYVNNGDGTFTESIKKYFPHCSYFSMGLDVTDINHDGYQDLFVVEMLSENNVRQKTNMAPMDMDKFAFMVDSDLHYQYMRNVFQINNGNGFFSDIAYYAGIDKTDWSWGTIFGDYDNDGDEDLVVVNGYLRDTQDKDFAKKSNELAKKFNNQMTFEMAYSLLESTPLSNFAFENTGNYKFENVSKDWGFDFSGYSNGVAYGDLDLDGDLDIIVNNINDEAGVYKNTTNSKNFIGFDIKGPPSNTLALNSKLKLYTSEKVFTRELQMTRSFQSSCDHNMHFGLGKNERVDSLVVFWNNNEKEVFKNINTSQYNTIRYSDPIPLNINPQAGILKKTTLDGIDFVHQEKLFDDYEREVLIPHKMSQLGPPIIKSDVDGNGFEDIFIGSAHGQAPELYFQSASGKFIKDQNIIWELDKKYEDTAATFFDFDSDGDQDLYIVSGSNEFERESGNLDDRYYENDGSGNYIRKNIFKNPVNFSGGCVIPHDFDDDGDTDLFVGGRQVPGRYPLPSVSALLMNDGNKLIDISGQMDTTFRKPGMISDALWHDINGDDRKDLIMVGEWTDILAFVWEQNKLVPHELLPEPNVGWWNCLYETDIDNDGDLDIIAGNLGQNYKYQATDEKPFEVYSGDFDENGSLDIVVGYYSKDKLYPVRGLQCSSEQIPDIKKKFPTYKAFGEADLYEIYGDKLDGALNYKANNFKSVVLVNDGNGSYDIQELPTEAQLFPVKDMVGFDANNDGYEDLVLVGNWFVAEIETPRADNGTGLILINDQKGSYKPLNVTESGFFANKDARNIIKLNHGSDNYSFVVANNNDTTQIFRK